ncbi:putative ABC transporter permease protein YurN [Paenibacillus glycanilyticus]|uniref:ABC transporter permease protein YurN n=2 Tax=Paenibacillus glycanilyticus TaxID=126569 RepID=A0ABQ6G529_9BACL|nr:putative ABC transporter permease protein YurN [Paenibacillus glycanilyticus]
MFPKKRTAYDYDAYLYLIPALLFIGLFIYYGAYFNVYHSFFKWNGISRNMTFIGFDNYVTLVKDPKFIKAITNTLTYMVITVILQAVIGLFVAVVNDSLFFGKRLFKSLFFLPNIMSLVVVAVIFTELYNFNTGAVNEALRAIGLENLVRDWTGDPNLALFAVMATNIFTYMGFSMIIYFTAITQFNQEVIESAKMDGAGFLQLFTRMIFPMLKSTHSLLLILGIIGSLKTFDLVWLITGGGPARSSEVVSTYLYRSYVLEYKGGYSAAISNLIMMIALMMTWVQSRIQKKWDV